MRFPRLQVSLRAAVEIWLWRRGWAWPVVGLLALVAVMSYALVLQPRRAQLAEVDAGLERARLAAHRDAASANTASTQIDARAVILASPPADRLVARMVELAQAEGIALPQSEYQQRAMPDAQLVQVQVTQPVRATYPQLRRYIEAVLRALPNASLDQLGARRENVGQPQLEARLRWSLWLPRAAISPGAAGQERPTP